jgi:hypothetical protein
MLNEHVSPFAYMPATVHDAKYIITVKLLSELTDVNLLLPVRTCTVAGCAGHLVHLQP